MPQSPGAKRQISRMQRAMGAPFLLWGGLILILGLTIYLLGVLLSIVRLLIPLGPSAEEWIQSIIWYSGVPTTVGLLLLFDRSDIHAGQETEAFAMGRG